MCGRVNVCSPSWATHALILAECCPSQETHNFLGKQSCCYTILAHRCSSAHWLSRASGGEREHLPMPISHRHTHTQVLFVMSVHFQKGIRVPYHWFYSQLACNSSLHWLMYRMHNQWDFVCLIFFFFCDIESQPHLASAAVDLEQSTRITGLMCYMCQDDHQSSECNHSI